MANLDRIVNVQIALNTTGISTEGFSTLLVVGPHLHSLARVETFTSAAALTEMGFSDTDPLYLAVADAFAQTPRPSAVKVGRRQVEGCRLNIRKVSAAGTYKVTVKTKNAAGEIVKEEYTFTNSGGSAEAIATGLAGVITADLDAAVTATVDNSAVVIAANDSEKPFALEVSSNLDMVADEPTETIAETMAAIKKSDSNWYGIALTSRKPEDILAMADWTEANSKLFGTSIAEAGAIDGEGTTDTGYKLMNGNYYRTFWFYHEGANTDFPETAVMARCFAIYPGGETWALKKLASVVTDGLTETEYNAVTKKNGNTFERFRNVSITQNGKTAAGEWIDVIRFRDWLQEEITVNVFNVMINSDKIPYTDGGIAIIEGQIRAALRLGQQRGGIAPTEYDEDGNENPGFVIEVPLASSISANTKASRVLHDVKFTARLAGAIHAVNITGSLTYENLIG